MAVQADMIHRSGFFGVFRGAMKPFFGAVREGGEPSFSVPDIVFKRKCNLPNGPREELKRRNIT